jgi:hypothetical protein
MTALDGLWQTAPAYLDSALRISSPQFLDEAKISTENIGIWQGAIAQELKCEVVRLSGGTSTGILVVTANFNHVMPSLIGAATIRRCLQQRHIRMVAVAALYEEYNHFSTCCRAVATAHLELKELG